MNNERVGPRLAANKSGYMWVRMPEAEVIARVPQPERGKHKHRRKWWQF